MNNSGSIVARYSYDPYGVATLVSGSNLATRQYAGLFYHPASGLDLGTYRLYKPTTGTWLSRDPLRNAEMRQGPNLYEYVHNYPVDLIDPLGLCPCGQHLGFLFANFAKTVGTMTGDDAIHAMGEGNIGQNIHFGPVDFAADLNKALTYVPDLEEAASIGRSAAQADPILLGYGVAVDLGAFLGSWGCVPDAPPDTSPNPSPNPNQLGGGNYYPTPNNYGANYNPNYNPYSP